MMNGIWKGSILIGSRIRIYTTDYVRNFNWNFEWKGMECGNDRGIEIEIKTEMIDAMDRGI